jgi:hypothetical protein
MSVAQRNGFARARAHFALIAAANALTDQFARREALNKIEPYESHGKRKTKTHNRGGTKAFQRVAAKRRNKARR